MLAQYYENDQALIAAHSYPARLMDYAVSCGIDLHHLLSGTGIFYDDVVSGELLISQQQLLTLVTNVRAQQRMRHASFQWGQRILPAAGGPVSQALLNAGTIESLLQLLERYQAISYAPIQWLHTRHNTTHYALALDILGMDEHEIFFMEAAATAITRLCRLYLGRKELVTFYFRHPQPDYIEQYETHIGDNVHFSCPVNAIAFDDRYYRQPFRNCSTTTLQLASKACDALIHSDSKKQSLLAALQQYLLSRQGNGARLQQTAEHFNMSAATLKRKLKKHHTNFQTLSDQCRQYRALYLLHIKNYSNEATARALKISDVNNFRRSFKRWTGLIPSAVRSAAD